MAKRDWNTLQWIAYYYIAFAIFTDREYNDSEKKIQEHFPDIKYIDLEIN